jgi:stage V sporulation protein AE
MAVEFVWAFLVGGALCLLAQLVVDLTPLTPAHTMVLFVVLGAVAAGLGLYDPLVKAAGAGASVPLTGFGNVLVQGVFKEIARSGWMGVLTGGLTAAAAGITAAVAFAVLAAAAARPKG